MSNKDLKNIISLITNNSNIKSESEKINEFMINKNKFYTYNDFHNTIKCKNKLCIKDKYNNNVLLDYITKKPITTKNAILVNKMFYDIESIFNYCFIKMRDQKIKRDPYFGFLIRDIDLHIINNKYYNTIITYSKNDLNNIIVIDDVEYIKDKYKRFHTGNTIEYINKNEKDKDNALIDVLNNRFIKKDRAILINKKIYDIDSIYIWFFLRKEKTDPYNGSTNIEKYKKYVKKIYNNIYSIKYDNNDLNNIIYMNGDPYIKNKINNKPILDNLNFKPIKKKYAIAINNVIYNVISLKKWITNDGNGIDPRGQLLTAFDFSNIKEKINNIHKK